jgi:hypothetical protein
MLVCLEEHDEWQMASHGSQPQRVLLFLQGLSAKDSEADKQ